MNSNTTREIESTLRKFVEDLLIDYRVATPQFFGRHGKVKDEPLPGAKPFHEAFFSRTLLRASSFERSFSTRLGNAFEKCAEIIGRERFQESQRNYKLRGNIALTTSDEIGRIVNFVGENGMTQPYSRLANDVASLASVDTARARPLTKPITIDLFLSSNGTENYFEMKSPQPNKDQCFGTTGKLLRVHAVRQGASPRINTYYGMNYNPYGTREAYDHSYASDISIWRSKCFLEWNSGISWAVMEPTTEY